MKKMNKNINITLIFMLIVVTYPQSVFCLRTPVGNRGTFYRMSEEMEPGDTQKQLLRRIHFYAQKLEKCNSLSETGKKYLGRLKQTSPESGIEELKDIIAQYPAPETPHLEYFDVGVFKGLSNSDKERIFRLLISLRVTEGCSFGCRHCAGSPSGKVQSMYFFRILAFLDAAKGAGLITLGQSFGTNATIIPGSITNYEFNEVFDYRCPITGADYGDVVSAILERFPEQRIYLNTRGWRLGDKHGQQAGEKIARLMKKYPDRVILDVSVDLYSLERGGVEAHIKRMVNIFKTFTGVPIHIRAAYDNNNEEETKLVVGRILSQVDKTYISLAGSRAPVSVLSGSRAGILSDREYDVVACSYGVHILPDGSVRIKIPVVNLSYRHGYVLSSCNAWLDNTGKKLLSGALPYGARPFNPSDNLSDDLQYSAIYRVKDLSRAVEFYKNKLGFTLLVEDQEEQWAIFLIDEKVFGVVNKSPSDDDEENRYCNLSFILKEMRKSKDGVKSDINAVVHKINQISFPEFIQLGLILEFNDAERFYRLLGLNENIGMIWFRSWRDQIFIIDEDGNVIKFRCSTASGWRGPAQINMNETAAKILQRFGIDTNNIETGFPLLSSMQERRAI